MDFRDLEYFAILAGHKHVGTWDAQRKRLGCPSRR